MATSSSLPPAKTRRSSLERTCQWVYSQEIAPDVTVAVGDAQFALHKFPLVAKSGYLRRLVVEADENNVQSIEIPELPGGERAFEDVAKFCYGINFEMTPQATPALWAAAHFLEMTEEYAPNNLCARLQRFVHSVVLCSIPCAVTTLAACEALALAASDAGLAALCADAIAAIAVAEFRHNSKPGASRDWWAHDLTALPIHSYRLVLLALKRRGLPYSVLGSSLMLYAQASLRGLLKHDDDADDAEEDICRDAARLQAVEQEQRIIIETIINLLPVERNAMSVTFLCGLLRSARFLGAREGYLLEVERRIALQLEQATHQDLLTVASPAASGGGDAVVVPEIDSVRRIISKFLDGERRQSAVLGPADNEGHCCCSASVAKVAKTLDAYLAGIATAKDLPVEDFVSLPRLLPPDSRDSHDGVYRAIDIFLKNHPWLDELQREKACSVLDTHRLSFEARTHAAQNKRLPLNVVLQVLYHDQLVARSGPIAREHAASGVSAPSPLALPAPPGGSAAAPEAEVVAALCKENEELRQEVARMKALMRQRERVEDSDSAAGGKGTPSSSASWSRNNGNGNRNNVGERKKGRLLASVAKGLGRLNPFGLVRRSKDTDNLLDAEKAARPVKVGARRRRFSIS